MKSDFTPEELTYKNYLKETQADAVSNILEDEKGIEEIIHVVENTSWFAGEMRDKIIDPDSPKVACKEKCHWCCHQSVGVTAPEVFRITKFIDENISAKEKQKLTNNLEKLDGMSRGKTTSQRAKLDMPCAFLNYGKCQIYEARPLACRRQTSYDIDACKKAKPKGFPFGSIVSEKAQLVAFTGSIQGMVKGLNNMLPTHEINELDLTASVLETLKDESMPDKWLNGQTCFSECKLNT